MNAPLAADYELIRFDCHECGQRYRAAPRWAGKQLRCKKCGVELTAPGQVKQEPSPPPGRPVRSWAIWLGCVATVTIAVSVLRMDAEPEVMEQSPAPVEVAEVEPEPEPEKQAPIPVALPEIEPTPPAKDETPASPPLVIPEGSPEFRSQFQLASAGDTEAMNNVAYAYYYGEGVRGDQAKAIEWYKRAAEEGNSRAMYNLGQAYEQGWGVAQNSEEAAAWYEEAAEAGHVKAMYTIATIYERGEGVDQDDEKAAEWYLKAAEAGDAVAMHNIGMCYAVGKGVPADKKLALQWLQKSTDAGYEDAHPMLYYVLAGLGPGMAATIRSNPIGGKYAETHAPPPSVATNQDSSPRLSPAERAQRTMDFAQSLISGRRMPNRNPLEPGRSFNSAGEAYQRYRFMQGMRQQQYNAGVQRSIRGR
jgi:tetratricopeptide (TPR) repeat protein